MKVAVTLLFVALSCYYGSGNAYAGYGGGKNVSSHVPEIPKDCVEKLVKTDVPETLTKLRNMLCNFMAGKKTHNMQLYKEFLKELHTALIDTGCTADVILSTPEFLENVGDKVGEVAEKVGVQVFKAVEDCELFDKVMNALCQLLGETLKNLSKSLAGLNVNTDMVNNVVQNLPVLG